MNLSTFTSNSLRQRNGRWEYWLTGAYDDDFPDYPIDGEVYEEDPTRPPTALSTTHGFDADTLELEVAIQLQTLYDADRKRTAEALKAFRAYMTFVDKGEPTMNPPDNDPTLRALHKANIGRMKACHLVTQRKDGRIYLRSFGRAALPTLIAAAMNELEDAERETQKAS